MGDNALVSWLTSYTATGNKREEPEPLATIMRSERRAYVGNIDKDREKHPDKDGVNEICTSSKISAPGNSVSLGKVITQGCEGTQENLIVVCHCNFSLNTLRG